MKKSQEKLKSKDEAPRIEGRKNQEYARARGGFFKRRERTFRNWYRIYIATTLATVLTVILLLVFGVGSNNVALSDSIKIGAFADKVADFFTGIDFSMHKNSDTQETDEGGFVKLPSNNQGSLSDTDTDFDTEVGKDGDGLYDYDYSVVPEGYTPIIPMDLSLSSYGSSYINNSTGYTPDVISLINKKLKADNGYVQLSASTSPQVLIIHTHGTEGYSDDGAKYCKDSDDYARTSDARKSVVAVGETICDILNKSGIPTAHCKIMHDSIQYKDSYARAEETIKQYLEEYPTIKLVIDIHRDSIIKSTGEIVRPVTDLEGKAAAQVMCVVGSSWEGDVCPNWENNLSLALKLRENLNDKCENICRPVFLKGHTYNQEIAPYSLLIEVGSSGNSLDEAQRSAVLIGAALSELANKI